MAHDATVADEPATAPPTVYKTIGAKIFYWMAGLVLLAVVAVAAQQERAFLDFQSGSFRDTAQFSAERASAAIEANFDIWRTQLAGLAPLIRDESDERTPAAKLKPFFETNRDFLLIEVLTTPGPQKLPFKETEFVTTTVVDNRLEDKSATKTFEALHDVVQRWLERDADKLQKPRGILVESFAKTSGLPIAMVAIRIDAGKDQESTWIVGGVWQTALVKGLAKSKFYDSVLVDGAGKILSSPNAADLTKRRRFINSKLLKTAQAAPTLAGVEPDYLADGKHRIGAFSRLPKYGMTVLTEADFEQAYQAVRHSRNNAALCALLLILIAAMAAYLATASQRFALARLRATMHQIGGGDWQATASEPGHDEFSTTGQALDQMASRLQNSVRGEIDQALAAQARETAEFLKSSIAPRLEPRAGPVAVTGFHQSATTYGGDFWGSYAIADGLEFIYVADVMGIGGFTAVATSMAHAVINSVVQLLKSGTLRDASPSQVLEHLNRVFFETTRGRLSMSCFAAFVDTNVGTLTFANAGHNFPLLIPANADDDRAGKIGRLRAELAQSLATVSLRQGGALIGLSATATFKTKTLPIRAGDRLLLYSNGLIKCSNPNGSVWGKHHLITQALKSAALPIEEMRDEILSQAFTYFANQPINDDVTLVLMEISKSWRLNSSPANEQAAATTEAADSSADSVSRDAPILLAPKAKDHQIPIQDYIAANVTQPPRFKRTLPPPMPPASHTEVPGAPPPAPTADAPSSSDSTVTETNPVVTIVVSAAPPASIPVAPPQTALPSPAPPVQNSESTPMFLTLDLESKPTLEAAASDAPTTPVPEPFSKIRAEVKPSNRNEPAVTQAPKPSSPTSSPAPMPLGRNGKYKIRLPNTGS